MKSRDYKDSTDLVVAAGFKALNSAKARSDAFEYEKAPCLSAEKHDACVVCGELALAVDCRNGVESPDVFHTLQAKESGGQSLNSTPCVRTAGTVRRLTPLECERLQGFPDQWTDIGDWTDSKGKLHKGDADSPRYKALGNSIALPPWAYVLTRLSVCAAAEPTMASLFDGVGGFPLIWEWLNGKGTCRWASEIEEFPIAVTKSRFPEEVYL